MVKNIVIAVLSLVVLGLVGLVAIIKVVADDEVAYVKAARAKDTARIAELEEAAAEEAAQLGLPKDTGIKVRADHSTSVVTEADMAAARYFNKYLKTSQMKGVYGKDHYIYWTSSDGTRHWRVSYVKRGDSTYRFSTLVEVE
jgi:DsbC/DsbD-like thiol-disulfide interchange protein